jgi:hypothetical protein
MHEYPKIGEDVPNPVNVLRKLNDNRVKLILWTIRSGNICRKPLIGSSSARLKFGQSIKIQIKDFDRNRQRLMLPSISTMPRSECPLKLSPDGNRPFADWFEIERLLKEIDYL